MPPHDESPAGQFRLVVISPEADDPRELAVLPQLLAAGLRHYHVRKPAWSRQRLAAWLRALPATLHPHLVLHTHHDLVDEFAVGGLHQREHAPPVTHAHAFTSRAHHDLAGLRAALGQVDRVLLSPIFNSISKPGHGPGAKLPLPALASLLGARTPHERRTEVVALGGIDHSRLDECRRVGFDGAAVLGAVWSQPDPVRAFDRLLNSLLHHAC